MRRFFRYDYSVRLLLSGMVSLACLGLAWGSKEESARLQALVLPGALEIETNVARLSHVVDSASVSGVAQANAVSFEINGLIVNDLNGDGRGWRLTATPEELSNGSDRLTLGAYVGFRNFGSLVGLRTVSPDVLVSQSSEGVFGLETDYHISYNVPAFASPGVYEGTVRFAIVAE